MWCLSISEGATLSVSTARFSNKYLPFNLAMLFLVDEMYRNVGKHFRISIGKPIPWQTFDKSKSATEWAQYVEDRVYEL